MFSFHNWKNYWELTMYVQSVVFFVNQIAEEILYMDGYR